MKIFSKKVAAVSSIVSALAFPLLAFAQVPDSPIVTSGSKNLSYIIDLIIGYLNQGLILLIGVAVVMFVFYVIKYFMRPADGAERAEAGQYVMYSIIGFFVIVSFWGLVAILKNTFNLDSKPQGWSEFQNIFPK